MDNIVRNLHFWSLKQNGDGGIRTRDLFAKLRPSQVLIGRVRGSCSSLSLRPPSIDNGEGKTNEWN